MKIKELIILLLFLTVRGNAFSQQVSLDQDIWQGNSNASPHNLTEYNGEMYFFAHQPSGKYLMKYDGVGSPLGIINTFDPLFNHEIIVYNNVIYFSLTTPIDGTELWLYDGTNLLQVEDFYSGSTGSKPADLTIYNNKLYFSGRGNTIGVELCEFDGVNQIQAIDINTNGSSFPTDLTVFNNKLYFTATDGINGNRIWYYDGVSTNSLASGVFNPGDFTEYNGKLYFYGDDGVNGIEVWEYDGITGPTMIADINPGSGNSYPNGFSVYNNSLYFEAYDGSNTLRYEYNGTTLSPFNNGPSGLQIYNGKAYYSNTDALGGYELWKYDGTNPPVQVADIRIGNAGSYPSDFIVFSNRLFFRANDGIYGSELWSLYESVDINEIQPLNKNMFLYPNPANDWFTIATDNLKDVKVKIYNSLGQIVINRTTKNNRINIQTSTLEVGVYFVSIIADNFQKTEKLVIK